MKKSSILKNLVLPICLFQLINLTAHSIQHAYPGQKLQQKQTIDPIIKEQTRLLLQQKKYLQLAQPLLVQKSLSSNYDTKHDSEKEFLTIAMSFKDFMEHSLHDPDWGFYGAGRVTFLPWDQLGDFWTYPKIMKPAFGSMLAYQSYAMWLSMIYSGDITPEETFQIIEFGAGDGDLGFDIMESIERNACQEKEKNLDTHWQEFYNIVTYTIGERAPGLRIRQQKTNKKFIDQNKFKIIATDARNPQFLEGKKIKGLILSNELLDTFCVHKALFRHDGQIKIGHILPILNLDKWSGDTDSLRTKSNQYFKDFSELLKNISIGNNEVLLSKDDYLNIKKHTDLANQHKTDKCIRFTELYLNASLFPEIKKYLNRHGGYIWQLATTANDGREKICYLNHTVEDFVCSIANILDKGFILTIDYGNTAVVHGWQFVPHGSGIRTFPVVPLFENPGTADITTDVNFTDIYLIGKDNGLDFVFYGSQTALEGKQIALTTNLVFPGFDIQNPIFAPVMPAFKIDRFLNSNDAVLFKMMIQKKTNKKNRFQILTPSESVFPN